jgi:hypothetical protein
LSEPAPYTGAWVCPLCGEHIPLTLYGRQEGGTLVFVDDDTPAPDADINAHVWSQHPEEIG